MAIDPVTSLLAVLAYQGLCTAESLMPDAQATSDLAERLLLARFSADALERFSHACEAIPGGPGAARSVVEPITGPVDEFWQMTKPRAAAEKWVRMLVVASVDLEFVQQGQLHLDEVGWEPAGWVAGLWRIIDQASQAIVQALAESTSSADELSLYARRVVGEAAMLGQRLIVRQSPLRQVLTGQPDDDLNASTAVLGEALGTAAARLSQLGLSV